MSDGRQGEGRQSDWASVRKGETLSIETGTMKTINKPKITRSGVVTIFLLKQK